MTEFYAATKRLLLAGIVWLGIGTGLSAGPVSKQGVEYAVTTPLGGDQVHSQLSLNADGGYLVWQDNATDGNGLGIGARRLDSTLNGAFGVFRVNEIAAGDQENPQVALLKDGGAVIAWQGGTLGFQKVYARFVNAAGTFVTGDIQVNTYNQNFQVMPQLAVLEDGNVIVIWSSNGQDGSMLGVYGQRLSPAGQRLGAEFQVAQSTANNQRSPSIAALPGGRFLVAWVSEAYKGVTLNVDENGIPTDPGAGAQLYDVQLYTRLFDAQANPLADELKISTSGKLGANPTLAVSQSGQVLLGFSGRKVLAPRTTEPNRDRWDIYAQMLDAVGAPAGPDYRVNAHIQGDQYVPRVAALGDNFLMVWTSLGQDGSREGVFSRVAGPTSPLGDEMVVNTLRLSQQLHPAVAAPTADSALVVWSSYLGGASSFDTEAQRFAAAPSLPTPSAPFVSAISQTKLSVTWPPVEGYDVAAYQVYADGNAGPIEVTANRFTAEGLLPGSSHSFKISYRLTDGRKSAISESAAAPTWGEDENLDGLPDDWQARYWQGSSVTWPGASEDSDGDGASNKLELLAGTDPTNPASALKLKLASTAQGKRLIWATQPGCIYQVQVSGNLGDWAPVGSERFAAEAYDSIPVDGSPNLQMYRIVRIR